MMKLAAIGLGAALVVTIVRIGIAANKGLTEWINYACDPNAPRRL